MRIFRSRTFLVTLLASALLVLVSCSKKDDNGSSSSTTSAPAASSTLLAWLPPPTTSFSYLDFSSSDYQNWKKSAYGELTYMLSDMSTSMIQSSTASMPDASKKMLAVYEAVKTSGLLPIDKTQAEPVKEMMYFSIAGQDGGAALANAYFFTAAPGVNLKDKLAALENALKAKGIAATRGGFTPAENFSVNLVDENASPEDKALAAQLGWEKAFVYATAEKLAVSNSQLVAEKFFGSAPANPFINSAKFKECEKFLPPKGTSHMGLAYFDFKALAQNLIAMAPPAEQEQMKQGLAQAPIGPIVGYAIMQKDPVMRYSVALRPTTDAHKEAIAGLKNSGTLEVLNSLPAQALLAIALDGGAIKSAKDSAMKEMPPEQAEMAGAQLGIVDSIKGFTLGAANATTASPFPEIFAIVSSSQAAELKMMIQSLAEMGSASGGMPVAPWQKKEISGVQVDFTLTPLGIGLFLGDTGNSVFLASSEAMATNIITTAKDPSQGLTAKVKELKFDGSGHLFAGYLDFVRLYDLIQSLQSTMAMFTGGQSSMDMKQFEILKKLGSGNATVSAKDDAIVAEIRLHAS